ncbi:RYamide receptor-like [Argiope bruennichi]|uniref:RYamide receptor like protein n=1 Tax=Argiope bruennichi TaxID=94029 RepID=A0A8T0FW30_ARGBR|nr:RYamide receptor-like [Argiope bruennichi]XP_055931476.1 RYamide receptor-like [Argiope bruennichi]XP_055931477.1 RYamide receptor-like [Argiope bruennichi]KAF8794946.1 RYamide receptor like protein [Argiope bruennichi]
MENLTEVFTVLLLHDLANFTNGTMAHVDEELYDIVDAPTVPKAVEALMYIMYIVISVAAIGGNVIVCYIVFAYQRMRSVTNFFIVNLAVGDILMASLCIPFGFVSNLLLQYWPFGAVMCVVVSYAQAVSVFISAYTLVAISFDRYIAILYPLRPRMTKLQAKLIIVLVWFVALLTPLPTAIMSKLEQPQDWIDRNLTDRFTCMEAWESNTQRYHYSMALMILQYFFPLAVLIYTYTRIAIVVWGKRTPGEAQDARDQRMAASKRKMVKMMITVVSVFTLCWLPLNALIVAGDEHDIIWQFSHIHYVWFVCHWLAMSSTAYNPIIYCWMNSKYRDGFRQVFVRLLCLPGRKKGFKTSLNRNGFNRYNTTNTIYTSIRSSGTHRGSQCSSHRGSIVKGHKSCARTESGNVSLSVEPKENTSLAPNGFSTSNMTDSTV